MADIIDRLISRVEFVGVSGAIASIIGVVEAEKKLEKQQERVAASSAKIAAAQAKVDAAYQRMQRSAFSPNGTQAGFDRAQRIYLLRQQRLAGLQETHTGQIGKLATAGEKVRESVGTFGAFAGGIVALQLLQVASAAAETSIKFENMRTSLTVLYRDAAKGQEAFNWILKFAKETPFSIESATQAFIRLTSLGIQPTRRNLMILGGLGQMFHRDFEDVAMAAGIGASGNFSRLIRGFGIRREDVARNAPPGAIPLNGPVPANMRPQVFEAILKTIEQKFPQAFEAFSKTTETARSNFYDSIQQILASFARLIFGSDSLKQTFDSLTMIAGFVNNFIQVLNIMKNAVFFTGTQILSFVASVLKHIPGSLGRRAENVEKMFDAAGQEATRQIVEQVKGMSKYANAGEPPKVPGMGNIGAGAANAAFQTIRQIVGQSGIAQIGVNASELPGLQGNPARRQPLLVKIEGSDGSDFMKFMEDAFNKLLFDANRHGYNLEPSGAH